MPSPTDPRDVTVARLRRLDGNIRGPGMATRINNWELHALVEEVDAVTRERDRLADMVDRLAFPRPGEGPVDTTQDSDAAVLLAAARDVWENYPDLYGASLAEALDAWAAQNGMPLPALADVLPDDPPGDPVPGLPL